MAEKKAGVIVILSSPSGAGKTTLVKKISLTKKYKISISHTTRKPRANEKPIRGTLSIKRAKDLIGFNPQMSLEIGYKKYCEWYIEQYQKVKSYLINLSTISSQKNQTSHQRYFLI